MSLVDSIKEAYYSIEDKWYSFVDSVSEKVPAVGSIVDAIEDKGIPSFPLAILIVFLLIIGIFFLVFGGATSTVSLTILDTDQNPIDGATVVVMQSGETVKEDYTDIDGKISFILPNGNYSVRATKDNYLASTKSISVNASMDADLILSVEDIKVTRAVYLKTASGDLITGYGRVFYKCKGADDSETKDTDYSNGQFNAELSESCSEVEVISLENYSLVNSTASFSGTGAVTVEEIESVLGNAAVTIGVASSTETVPAGLKVKLVPIDGTVPIEALTSGTNVVLFNDVSAKTYYVLVQDLSGNYLTYNGSTTADTKEVKKGETTQFTAVLTKTPSSTISISIKDSSTNLPVKGAEVKLASAQNSEDYQTQTTGATGQLTFNVSQGGSFVVTVDQVDYLIGDATPAQAGDNLTIALTKADSTNSNSLLVRVVDSKKNPIDNVRVTLKTLDVVQPVVAEKMTGTSGEAEFDSLMIGKTYMVVASKENFGSVNSESVQVSPRAQKVLEVPFNIEEKTVTVKVVTPENTPISGASIKAVNYFTSEQIGTTQSTGSEGTALFTVRADKKVYFVAEVSGYAKYYTSAEYVSNLSEKLITMQKESAQLKASIISISSNGEEVNTSGDDKDTLGEGTYTVIAVVQVPKGTFSEAGLHLRTGKETQNVTNLVEEDGLYIGNAKSSGKLLMGTTFTPPTGYDVDSKNLITTGNAKWVNSTWKNPASGTYELESEITVTETNPNAPLNIYYRAWAKGSSVLRYPAGTLTGNELYAPANVRMLSSGATNLCSGNFCKTVTVQALSGSEAGKKKYVTGTIEAKKDVDYLLTIDLVNYSGRAISGAVVDVEGVSLDINALSVNGFNVEDLNAFSVGTIGVDSPLALQILFKPVNSGASSIKLSINSSTQTELETTYNVNVNPNKTFTLEMTPKVIVPYLENTLYFTATDENTDLSGVIVSIKNKTNALGTATTNGEGIAQFTLASPKVGAELTITAKKEGYNDVVITKTVDKAILTLVPPKIEETIKIGETTAIETGVIIENETTKTVKLLSATINGDIKSYMDVKFNDTINGTIIESGADKNYTLSMKLNSAASRLTEPKDVTGTIVLHTEVSGQNQSFINEIPVEIRLTFPGLLDSGKCLKITPSTIDLVTTSTEVTKTITLTNTCTAEDISVDLRSLEAKLNEASKFGTISLVGSGLSADLEDKYSKLGDILEKDSETEVTLKYTPTTSVESGTQALTMTVLGRNLLDDGSSEKVEASTKINITMNNLAKCIVVEEPEDGVIIDTIPGTSGYSSILSSDYSASLNSSLNSYQGFNNTNYLSNRYGSGLLSGYTGSYASGVTTYAESSFTITNNCTSDVEINLDVDSRINVEETEFTIAAGSDSTVIVQPGYKLGKYAIKVNARLDGTKDSKKKIDDVSVLVRRLGDIDNDCIKTNVTSINLNSFIMKPQKYSAYNYCYDSGVMLARGTVASINCSAPTGSGIQSLPYLQVGYESTYGNQYQLGSGISSYNQYYSNTNACGTGSCSLVTGTNIRSREVTEGDSGSIERVDFDVVPNPNYISQRRLFNNKYGTAGLFQNLSDIRQWATETDARTDVYGNLNINYTNAYGTNQCMEFPITISDIWRLTESIDSAVNWGDPQASPVDCQRKDALDIMSYWKSRNPSTVSASSAPSTPSAPLAPNAPSAPNTAGKSTVTTPVGGVVPESEYSGSNKNIYIFTADPAALRIGPMPTTYSQYYPQAVNTQYDMSYFQQQSQAQQKSSSTSSDAKANCGLMDSIKVLTNIPAELTGGAIVTVETTHSGSLLKNTYGSNLMVQVDRSAMTSNCVKLEIPIKASVTRAITMETQELTWNLRILFTKQGYQFKGDEKECMNIQQIDSLPTDCTNKLKDALSKAGITSPTDAKLKDTVDRFLKENESCKSYVSLETAINMLTTTAAAGECGTDINGYGFDKIKTTKLNSYKEIDVVDCTKYFCNDSMLQSFLLHKFAAIKEKVNALNSKGNATSLVELYRAAPTKKVANCADGNLEFFTSTSTGGLATRTVAIPSDILTKDKINSISSMDGSALSNMISVLSSMKDINSLLIEFDENTSFDAQYDALKMTKVGNKRYMALNGYINMLTAIRDKENDPSNNCNKAGVSSCTITYCGNSTTTLETAAFYGTITKGRLVQGVIDKNYADMNKADIELVYKQNPALGAIHNMAKYDSEMKSFGAEPSLMLTANAVLGAINATPELWDKETGIENYRTEFINASSTEVGLYSADLNYDLSSSTNTVEVTLGEKKAVPDANKASENVLLNGGFNFSTASEQDSLADATDGIIIKLTGNASGVFYNRVPLKMTATLYGTETGLSYVPTQTSIARPSSIIKWYASSGSLLGNDKYAGDTYTIAVRPTGQAQTIKGIYYYPTNGVLGISAGITGGTMTVKSASTLATFDLTQAIPGKNKPGFAIESSDLSNATKSMTLDTVIGLIKDKQACLQNSSVVWNESKLLK